MKKIVFLFTMLCLISASALAQWKVPAHNYEVRANYYDEVVPAGYYQVTGQVLDKYSGEPLTGMIVTNAAMTLTAYSDSTGWYELMLPVSDTTLYCYDLAHFEFVFDHHFQSRHRIELDFFMDEIPKIAEPVTGGTIEVYPVLLKPVIYAYNAASSFTVSLKPAGQFTFTYPESKGEWTMKTNEDGTLTDVSSGKNYPYIFWESAAPKRVFKTNGDELSGYLIQTDSCAAFFENVLNAYGLSERETADFIAFWAPRVLEKEYALIQFLTTETYNEDIAELTVHPRPLSMLRLYMYFMPLDNPDTGLKIIPPAIAPFSRNGFTLVEWGGSVLSELPI